MRANKHDRKINHHPGETVAANSARLWASFSVIRPHLDTKPIRHPLSDRKGIQKASKDAGPRAERWVCRWLWLLRRRHICRLVWASEDRPAKAGVPRITWF